MWDRPVVHLNVAHFAAQVERLVDPRLREREVIVAPPGSARAVVFDLSQEAYLSGARKGMLLGQALRRCPRAQVLPPHIDRYERAMADVLRLAQPYSPLCEAVDEGGHLFLDLSGTRRLFGPPQDVAWRLRREVKQELGLFPIWALAENKLVAKVASRLVKPQGEYIVESGEEEEVLSPLPLSLLPGVEPEELRLLGELHLRRVGQVARLDPDQLRVVVGSSSQRLYEAVRGVDRTPVLRAGQQPPQVREALDFVEDEGDPKRVEAGLYGLIERAGRTLRERGLVCRRLGLTLDYSDGVRLIRSATSARGTAWDMSLFALGCQALSRGFVRRVRLRHLAIVCDRLAYPPAQLELFSDEGSDDHARRVEERIVCALDRVRARYGPEAVRVGRTLTASAVVH